MYLVSAFFWVVVGLLVLTPSAFAQEVGKAECAKAYEGAQERRASGNLRKARESLVICANQGCPAFVQSDCATWLAEVEGEIPTIVIAAKDPAGDDTVDVRVLLDGEVIAEALDGKSLDVDPGMHTFKFEMPGAQAIENKLLIRQGERNRFIEVEFVRDSTAEALDASPYSAEAAPSRATNDDPPAEPEEPASGQPGPLRPFAYVAGGIGVAGIIGFAAFGLAGKSQQSDLESGCGQSVQGCAQSDVDSVKTKFLLADVFLGLGVAGIGTGVALFFLSEPSDSPSKDSSRVRLNVSAAPRGGFAAVSGAF
jgi:hypothetical protein